MVEESRKYKRTTASVGEGVLMYRAGYGQGKERHAVRFLPGNLLVHKSNPRMEPTQWRVEPSESDEEQCVELDDGSFISTERERNDDRPVRKSRRISEKVPWCSEEQLTAAIRNEVSSATAPIRTQVLQIQKKVSAMTMCTNSCARDQLIAEQVEIKRCLIRRLFLESMIEKPRPWRKSNTTFGQILRASAEEVHVYLEMDLFLNIVADIAGSLAEENVIMFSPPLEKLQSRMYYLQKAEIRFGSVSGFLDWLEISQEDVR